MDGWILECINGCVSGWIDDRKDVWRTGWLNGWMGEWIDRRLVYTVNHINIAICFFRECIP